MRAAVWACLLLLTACPSPESAVDRAVRAYNDAAIRAYALNDASGMPAVATTAEAQRVRVLVDLKASNRLALEASLERFRVTSTLLEPGGTRARVETEERWRYFDRPLVPGRPVGPTILSEMRMAYDCVKESGAWKVAEVSTLENRILEPRDYQHTGTPRDAGAAP